MLRFPTDIHQPAGISACAFPRLNTRETRHTTSGGCGGPSWSRSPPPRACRQPRRSAGCGARSISWWGYAPVSADVQGAGVVAEILVAVGARPQVGAGFEDRVGPGGVGLE